MVPDQRVYSARSPQRPGSPSARRQARYQRSKPARIAASSGSLARAAAPAMRSDVAASAPGPAGGSSPASVDALRPTPTTAASPAASARIPASFAALGPGPEPALTLGPALAPGAVL